MKRKTLPKTELSHPRSILRFMMEEQPPRKSEPEQEPEKIKKRKAAAA